MPKLSRILLVFLTMRLLMPPGICACTLSSPAARFLVDLFRTGREVPPPPAPDAPDDHDPGCPASPLAAGMGVKPPEGPPPVSLALGHLSCDRLDPAACPPLPSAPPAFPTEPFPRPPDGVRCQALCALVI